MSSENSKNMLGMVDLSNVGDDALLYIKILFEKTQRLEKENKELKEVVGIGMVGDEERKFFIQHSTKVEKENEKLKKDLNMLNWYLCSTGQWGAEDTGDDRLDRYCWENEEYAIAYGKKYDIIRQEDEISSISTSPPPYLGKLYPRTYQGCRPGRSESWQCECCGASEGGQIQGCDDCEIYKVSSGMWWSKEGWAVKDDE